MTRATVRIPTRGTPTRPAILRAARKAIERISDFAPYVIDLPLHVRLELKNKDVADGYEQWRRTTKPNWPGRRVNGATFEAILESTEHIGL